MEAQASPPVNLKRRWTAEEDARLVEAATDAIASGDASVWPRIGRELGRSSQACASRAARLRAASEASS